MISWNARFTIVALLLAGTAFFLQARARTQFVPPRTALASFPLELKTWAGRDIPIPDYVLKTLGPGEFLQRTYTDQMTRDPNVDLYLAYFPNNPLSRHLPQDCLEASGWSPVESSTATLMLPGDTAFPAKLYLIAKGPDRQLVLFWYSAQGRRVARDFYLGFDSLRFNRADTTLIRTDTELLTRMNTELRPGERPDEAKQRLLSFAGLVNPILKNYIPQ